MAAATHDIKTLVGTNLAQGERAFQFRKRIDFSAVDGGSGAGAGETCEFIMLPAGAVVKTVDSILRTAEGATQTFDVGDEADPDGWLNGGDGNGTPDVLIALAGTEAYAGGKLYDSATGLRITAVDAADAAVVDVVVSGYMVDDQATA